VVTEAGCKLIGRWRIIEADVWAREYLDLVEPAYLRIGRDGWAQLGFGAVTAGGIFEYSKTSVFFRWTGSDEGTDISGEASAELKIDGLVEIELSLDNGDEANLIARRA
jgi:hypothetical protein